MMIAGQYDRQAHPESQAALARSIAGAEFQLFDAGHGVLFANPKATNCVIDFIQKIEVSCDAYLG